MDLAAGQSVDKKEKKKMGGLTWFFFFPPLDFSSFFLFFFSFLIIQQVPFFIQICWAKAIIFSKKGPMRTIHSS